MAKSKTAVKQNFDFNDFIAAGYRVPQASAPAADETAADQPQARGMLRGVADTGLEVVSGAAKGIKFMSDVFGADNAVSGALNDVSKYVKGLQSAQAQGEDQRMAQIMKEAEDKGIWEQVKAGLSAASEAPVRQTIGALATGIPQIAATMVPGLREASWGTRMATLTGLGAAQGAGMAKSSMYDAVYQRATEEGRTPEEAAALAEKAQAYSGDNAGQIALNAALGGAATGTGFAPALLKTMGKRAATDTAQDLTMPTMGKALGMGVVKETPLEMAQGGVEQYSGNVAQNSAGFDTPLGRGVAASATMEGALSMGGGLAGGAMDYRSDAAAYRAQEAAAQAQAEADAAKTKADALRATKPQGDGPLSNAVGAGIEAEAQKVEAAPVLGARLSATPMADMLGGAGMTGTDPLSEMLSADRQQGENTAVRMDQFVDRNQAMLTGGGLTGNADPVAGMIAGARESDATSETNIRSFAQSRPPMVASDAARILDEAKTRGLDFTAAPHPDGGFMVVPRQWVTPAVGQRAETEIADTLTRMAQADAAPVERAPRARAEAVDLTLPTADPVRDYVDGMRKVNTPAAKFYVSEFDAGRITPADVKQRMQAERGKTPDERLADAAAQAPKNTAQPGDILNPSGQPFKTLMSARLAAQKTPGDVIEVVGGYSVRPKTEVTNAKAVITETQSRQKPDKNPTFDAPQTAPVPASVQAVDQGTAPSVEPVPTAGQAEPVATAVAGQPEQAQPLSDTKKVAADATQVSAESKKVAEKSADDIARALTDSIGRNAIKNHDKYWDEQVKKGYSTPDRAETGKRQGRETWENSKVSDRTQKLAQAIADKDPSPLVEAWAKDGQGTSGSEGSMDGFKELTGINLKRLNSAARAKAIYDWAGWDDARVSADVAQRNQATSQRKAEQEAKSQADTDSRTDRVASTAPLGTKDGQQLGTVKSWVDELVGQGFSELRQVKKGAITKTFLANPATGAGYPMPTGLLREYAEVATRRAKAVKAKPVEATKPAQSPAPKAENLPDGWTAGTNGFTGRPVYRFNQGVGQPFAVVTRTEMGYEVQVRHGDKLVESANMPGAAKFEALSTASEMLAKVATHKDPGEKPEAATPAVVTESLKKAAKNEDVKPADMKKWLLGELDKAMLAAPDRNDYDDTVKGFGAADALKMWTGGGNYGKDTHTGFLSFDVPGDGKFKVRNGMRGLLEFRQNVERSEGFSNTGARPVAPERNNGVQGGSGGQMSAITNMIEEGDFEAARDYAEAVGIALADVKVPRGEHKPQWSAFLKDGTVPTADAPLPKKEDSWRKQLEDAKQSGDKKALQALHDKVRVALNGPAQAAGAEAVSMLEGLKTEIEQYAKQDSSTVKPDLTDDAQVASNPTANGDSAAANIKRGNEAMDSVIRDKKDEIHAMDRPDHGPVSFIWGKVGNPSKGFAGGNGIAKIIAKRTAEGADGEAVARKMVEVIALGEASTVYGPKGGERFNVKHDGHTAVLSLHRFGNEETWLLTGWDDVESGDATAGNASDTYAPESSGIRSQEGADDGSVPPTTQPAQAEAPKLTPAEATDLMEWQNMGQTDNVQKHTLFFYESKADKDAKRGRMSMVNITKGERSSTGWMVDGDDQKFGPLALAKKRGMEIGMARAVADGYVEADEVAAKPEPKKAEAKPASKIDDFGEKIAGAKKDLWTGFSDDLGAVADDDIASHPLSKVWPAPDYQALIDGGADPAVVAFVRAARDEVPSKPRVAYKVKGWANKVKTLRGLAVDLMAGKVSMKDVETMLERSGAMSRSMQGFMGRVELYKAVGHEKSLDGIRMAWHNYTLYRGQENVSLWVVEKDAAATAFSNWPREIAIGKTKEEAIEAFRKAYDKLDADKEAKKGVQFDIVSYRGETGYWITKKLGRNNVKVHGPMATVKEARDYRDKNQAALVEKLEKIKEIPAERRDVNEPRVGEDMRGGADVTPQMFGDTFGFKGVQFGNWVEQGRRQQDLNNAFDALMDMAAVLGIPPKAISLDGQLGLAFGARGSGGKRPAAAHYESDKVVINLTKVNGAGSLGHEWWHAVDNYFAKMRKGRGGDFMTVATDVSLAARDAGFHPYEGVRTEMVKAFGNVVKAINLTGMKKRAAVLDGKRSKDYWTTGEEMSARSFEAYLIAKLQDQNASNDYLANILSEGAWEAATALGLENENSYPYPTAKEVPGIRAAFDQFFQTVQTKETEGGNVALFSQNLLSQKLGPKPTLDQIDRFVQRVQDVAKNVIPVTVVGNPAEINVLDVPAGSSPSGALIDGRIYLFSDNIKSVGDAYSTLFHEIFHLGLQKVIPAEAYSSLLKQFSASPLVARYVRQWKQSPEGVEKAGTMPAQAYDALATEEALAMVSETLAADQNIGSAKLPGLVKRMLGWFAQVADQLGFPANFGNWMRGLTQTAAERFVSDMTRAVLGGDKNLAKTQAKYGTQAAELSSQNRLRSGVGADGGARFRQTNEALKGADAFSVKGATSDQLAHYRGMGMQVLGRRQIVDLYGDMLPELKQYDALVQRMEADKNESGAEADALVNDWAKLDERGTLGVGLAKHPGMERKLAELMHDATLAQIDPDKPLQRGDDPGAHKALAAKFEALSPKAQEVYRTARDMYANHFKKVQAAIQDRIQRSGMDETSKAKMIAKMDADLFNKLKGVYFPLARFGKYVVVSKNAAGETVSVSRAETLAEANKMRREVVKNSPPGVTVSRVYKDAEFNASRDAVGKGFVSDLMTMLQGQGVGEDVLDSVGQLYLSSLPDLSWAKHGIHRKGTPGFSQDARRAFAQNMFHGARHLAKLRHSDQLADKLMDMEERVKDQRDDEGFDQIKARQVVDEMNARHELLMNPKTSSLSTALTSVGFVWFLGISPASALVNLSQTALVAYPVMAAKWGFQKAGTALLSASAEVVRAGNDLSKVLKGDELAAFQKAVDDGTIDVTQAHDLAGVAQGEDERVAMAMRPVMRAASFMFHHAEKFNRQATFIAAYRLAKESGAAPDVAFEQAKKATYDGHFDYGAANRPRIMQGNWQKVLFLFKQYGQNMVYTLTRQAYLSMKGMTPQQRTEARKQLGGLLAMHAMAAGALGLPLVGVLLSAASMLGSDDDEPWDAEVAMKNMMADAMGPKAAEVMAHGLSRLTPWDLSGRVALNKLILPDIQEGIEGQPLGEKIVTAAAGPMAGMFVGILKGMAEMGQGQYQRGLESMLPVALKNLVKAMRFGEEGVVDKTGIVIKDEVGMAGVLGQASGFRPSEVALATEGRTAIYQANKALTERRSSIMRMYAQARMTGDTDGVKDAMKMVESFNAKNPTRRIAMRDLIQSVKGRNRRIEQAEQGVYLPKTQRDALAAGRFALAE